MRIRIQPISLQHQAAFLAAVRRSVDLHRPWTKPPATPKAFREYVATRDGVRNFGFIALTDAAEVVGVVNVNEVVRGLFQSGYLGYYAFRPHDGRGNMKIALRSVVSLMFRSHRLHRLEANIQPQNRASIALVKRLGFRKEGLSPRYLKIGGTWKDHERWAITKDAWPG